MEKKITEHVIKLSGKATLLEPIDISKKYKVEVDGSVISTTDEDNQDGSYTRYYKYQPVLVRVLGDLGEVIKAKDIRKWSQKLRAVITHRWEESQEPIDSEEYYDREMSRIVKAYIEGRI